MALPERDLVEQHVIQHAVERRYIHKLISYPKIV